MSHTHTLGNPPPFRGHSQMTSAVRGREGGGRFLTIGGGGCVISILRILTRGEGVQNLENLADVIYEWPLSQINLKEPNSLLSTSGAGRLRGQAG